MTDILKDDTLFPYLQGIHLDGKGEAMLTVRSAGKEVVVGPQGESTRWVVRFQDTSKGLILNKTNTMAMVKATGERDTDKWPGKVVRMKAESVKAFGKTQAAIRVVPKPPTPKMLEAYQARKDKSAKSTQKKLNDINDDLGLGQ